MTAPSPDVFERAALCALLSRLGPDAPTLIQGWTTDDLAAHLVLREHDPLAAPGLVIPGTWRRFAERRRRVLLRSRYDDLVATIRSGPPVGFFRIPWVRRVANLNEYFVHHEDVRRANRLPPRSNPLALEEALWSNVGVAPGLLTRRARGIALQLAWVGTERVVRTGHGRSTVRVTGTPGELLLFLFGRQHAADVVLSGPGDAVASLAHARLGI